MFAQAELNKLVGEVGGTAGNLCPAIVSFLLFIFGMGIVLRTACSLYNALVGGKDAADGVPMPTLVGSMMMVFISFIVTGEIMWALVWTAASLAFSTNLDPAQAMYYAWMATIPMAFLVLSVFMALFLPAPIFRALLIAILCIPVAIVLFILLVAIAWVAYFLIGATHPALQKLPWAK